MNLNQDVITSRNNPIVKWAASLQDKKWRDREGCFIAEGTKLTLEAIEAGLPIHSVFVDEDKKDKILPRIEKISHNRSNGNFK